jgi:hypothetical protein
LGVHFEGLTKKGFMQFRFSFIHRLFWKNFFRSYLRGFSLWIVAASLLLTACLNRVAKHLSSNDPIDKFSILQDDYFAMLRLGSDKKNSEKIPEFEASLDILANDVQREFADRILKSETYARAGLILIYNSLLIQNNTNGIAEGTMQLGNFKGIPGWGQTSYSPDKVMLKRSDRAIAELEIAKQLRPDDRRIDSWIVGAKMQREKLKNSVVSDATFKNSLDAVKERPTFNLWTAILLFKNQDPASPLFETLAAKAKEFVDATRGPNDPCKLRPQDCKNGNVTPFNSQASIVTLGDVFLREAEVFLAQGEIPKAMELASYAKGTYSELNGPRLISDTRSWPDNDVLAERTDRVDRIFARKVSAIRLQDSPSYFRPYQCSSCHGR